MLIMHTFFCFAESHLFVYDANSNSKDSKYLPIPLINPVHHVLSSGEPSSLWFLSGIGGGAGEIPEFDASIVWARDERTRSSPAFVSIGV